MRRAIQTAIIAAGALAAHGCITAPGERNLSQRFDLPDTDVLLIDWQECSAAQACMRGELDAEEFALGFKGSPSAVAGKLGGKALELQLDQSSVYSYGNQIIEMTYTDAKKVFVLAITWNEQTQRLLDAQLVRNAD